MLDWLWFGLNLLAGSLLTLSILSSIALFQLLYRKRKLRRAPSLMKFLRRELPLIESGEHRLWEALNDTQGLQLSMSHPRRQLSEEEASVLMLVKGLDGLIRKSDVDWRSVDALIQRAMGYSLRLHNERLHERGEER